MLTRERAAGPPRALTQALIALGLVAFAALCAVLWRFTVDDAYTTLRYARHLAEGLGPTFNRAPPRAEGYSSLLWMLLLAPPHALRLDALAAAKALGVAFALLAAGIAGLWARAAAAADGGARWAAAAAATLALALPATAVHAVSGMETALAAALVTALLACAAHAVHTGSRGASRALPPLATLLALTRPEGALAGAVALATVAWLRRAERAAHLKRALLLFVLPLALDEAWRWRWYGVPLPLPFYVKLAHPGLLPGPPVVGAWLADHAWRLGPFALAALLRPPRALLPALAVAAAWAAFFTLPQHLMGYQHRYLAPLDPTLAVLAGVGLDRLVRAAEARAWPRAALAWAPPALLLLAAAGELADARIDVPERLAYADGMAAAHVPLGRELAALSPGGRLALSDAGAIPCLCDWTTRDLIGLNDARIALTRRRDPADVLAPPPDVIVLVSWSPTHFVPWDWNAWERPIFRAALAGGYRRVALRRFGPDYWLYVLARPETRIGAALARWK